MRKILFGVLALVVAGFFLSAYRSDRAELRQLQLAGKVATVDPITEYTEYRNRGSTSYTAEFRFQTEDGRKVQARKSFPYEVLQAFQRHEAVRIHYDPGFPNTFRFDAERPATGLLWFGIGAAVVGLFLVIKGLGQGGSRAAAGRTA